MTTKVPVELSSTPGIADSSNATAITIDSSENTTFSGDVEVGTTAPKINLKNTDTSIVADQSLGVIEIESTDGSTGSAGTIAKLDIAASGAFDGSGHGSDFRFTTGATNQSGSIALSEVMRITSTGRVGIGKTDPNYHLVVGGTNPKIQIYDSAGSGQTNLYFGDSGSNLAGYIVYQHNDNVMRFGANASEAMRIASNGNVMVGTTSSSNTTRLTVVQPNNDDPIARFDMAAAVNAIRGVEIRVTDSTANSSTKFFLQGDDNGTTRIELRTNGSIYASANSYSSDIRLKENIEDCEPMLEKLKQVRIVDFDWKDNAGPEGRQRGVIAQEIESIFPELIHQPKEYKEFLKSEMTPILVKAIQEQQTIIEDLKSRIETLEE